MSRQAGHRVLLADGMARKCLANQGGGAGRSTGELRTGKVQRGYGSAKTKTRNNDIHPL